MYRKTTSEKISKKELRKLNAASREMDKGKYITANEAISLLGKL
ncbi:MAG TPA: hypothetical protein VJG83_03695 [archaeon]|nr:hypothetical protein [archaeon]